MAAGRRFLPVSTLYATVKAHGPQVGHSFPKNVESARADGKGVFICRRGVGLGLQDIAHPMAPRVEPVAWIKAKLFMDPCGRAGPAPDFRANSGTTTALSLDIHRLGMPAIKKFLHLYSVMDSHTPVTR
jgi:hypothetical protein